MIGYYEITEAVYNHLISDEDLNTVLIGGTDDIDTNKQTIFPLAHILVGAFREPTDAITEYDVTVSLMDIVDQTNKSIDEIAVSEQWKGLDNKQDILNTMGACMKRLTASIRNGDLLDLDFELVGIPQADVFEDRFENLLTGWSRTYTIQIPNKEKAC